MEYLTSPGEACYTPSDSKKITERINKFGNVKVKEVRGVWMHYTHLRQSEPDFVKVSTIFCEPTLTRRITPSQNLRFMDSLSHVHARDSLPLFMSVLSSASATNISSADLRRRMQRQR
ncbi:hypothetical protein B0J14DRAFT_193157 [Halenospora varia]|nr:hypothetical protein B0J14DRAFT_193157 [Halenospora varia]